MSILWPRGGKDIRERVTLNLCLKLTLKTVIVLTSHWAQRSHTLKACFFFESSVDVLIKLVNFPCSLTHDHPVILCLSCKDLWKTFSSDWTTRLRTIMRFSNLLFMGIVTLGTSQFCSAGPLHAQCKVEW